MDDYYDYGTKTWKKTEQVTAQPVSVWQRIKDAVSDYPQAQAQDAVPSEQNVNGKSPFILGPKGADPFKRSGK